MQNQRRPEQKILTINSGSSSIKFALYRATDPLELLLRGWIDRIGTHDTEVTITDATTRQSQRLAMTAGDHRDCALWLLDWLAHTGSINHLAAVGHRVVHGGPTYRRPERVTPEMLVELRRLSPYDPEHLPAEIDFIEAVHTHHPLLPQVACFDTAFHRELPRVAQMLPIPRRYESLGLHRYGFHGLSYAYLAKQVAKIGSDAEVHGRIIFAHLGSGASMAAVRDGHPVDTTMGFTPTSGLMMSRRSGDLDPGLVSFLARTQGMDAERFHHMVNTESGLLGVSETSSDMRDLLEREPHDLRAAEAIALFCYQAKKWVGALTAALGGLNTLVFSGGIGEHAPSIRARICQGLEFLGIAIDEARNATSDEVISATHSRVVVRVMHTDEEGEIAHAVMFELGAQSPKR
jgi:acetate kinase